MEERSRGQGATLDYCEAPKVSHVKGLNLPVNPGVAAAIFLASPSLSILGSSLIGRKCTLKIDALPLMSGGPERNTMDMC